MITVLKGLNVFSKSLISDRFRKKPKSLNEKKYQLKVLDTYINSDINKNDLLIYIIALFNFIMPNNLSASINLVTAAKNHK